jgi:hypothetical protein
VSGESIFGILMLAFAWLVFAAVSLVRVWVMRILSADRAAQSPRQYR